MNIQRLSLTIVTITAGIVSIGRAQDSEDYELPPINYSHAQSTNAITRLPSAFLTNDLRNAITDRAVLQKLLVKLHIPVTSQLLVFSKTSFQNDRINPEHPRALYYTDDCYIGWVPGGLVEVAAIDPKLGPVFYSFDPRKNSDERHVEFSRKSDCLRCHGGQFVRGIPGVFARSVFATKDGDPIFRQGSEVVDYHTPFTNRWGGWYVTGLHGKALHRGNSIASENGDKLVLNSAAGANVTNLSSIFDTDNYIVGTSDIVSLLIFEHQTGVQNVLTHAGIACRRMLDYQSQLLLAFKETATNDELHYESVRHVFDHSAEEVVDSLLFKDEAELPDGIVGSPDFQKSFAAGAVRTRDGNSLKDLALTDHLFKNRCSYLIYSDSFRSLPHPLKTRIYARLAKALDPRKPDPRYGYLHESERKRIADILRETHPDFSNVL